MGNILGQPFLPWVTKQIELRQQSLGYKNFGNKDLLNQNAKTPWIRLASAVDIKPKNNDEADGLLEKLQTFGIESNNIIGRNAARNFILQGGAVSINDNNNFKQYSGLNDGSFYSGAYGWGGTTEKGFTPLPGIIDASLVYYNNGALSKAVINMKCYNRNQLALMDALYMRPGYNLLLEFGWSTYLDNNTGNLVHYDRFQSPALELMLSECPLGPNDNPANFEIPKLIQDYRVATSGNYEGVFGKVTNFKWEFNPDGSYNCQTTITGMGGVIESLKIGGATPDDNFNLIGVNIENAFAGATLEGILAEENPGERIKEIQEKIENAQQNYTKLDKKLDTLYTNATRQYKKRNSTGDYNDNKIAVRLMDAELVNFPDPNDNFNKKSIVIDKGLLMHDEVETDSDDILNPTMFISLGYFFGVLQQDFLIYNEEGKPMFSFDVDFTNLTVDTSTLTVENATQDLSGDTNYFQYLPGQFSGNPTVCITPFNEPTNSAVYSTWEPSESIKKMILLEKLDKIKPYFNVSGNEYLGRLMFVYVNYAYLKKLIRDSSRNKDNTLPLLTFLQTMFNDISKALGGINKIEIYEDTSTNKIKFIENIPQNWGNDPNCPPPGSKDSRFCKLNTFGVKNNVEGSIVKNIDLNATISKEFASMISIGAQSNGNQVNENATAFATYNKGLIDRTFVGKSTESENSNNTTLSPKEHIIKNNEKLLKLYNKTLSVDKLDATGQYRKGLIFEVYWNTRWNMDNISSLENNNKTWTNLLQGCYNEYGAIQPSFFLPFNLSLDIEGISGIQLFQKFQIDDNVLPPSYAPNSVDIQIKAANHTVNSKEWTTKIETQSVPRATSQNTDLGSQKSRGGRRSFTQNDIEEVEEPTLETITSKFPLNRIFFDTVTSKKQIYLHHTVSDQDIKSVIDGWNRRTDRVSTHYVSNNSGKIEQLYEDDFWAYHLGVKRPTFAALKLPYQNLNRTSIGIELCSYGGLTETTLAGAESRITEDDDPNTIPPKVYKNAFGEIIDSSNVIQAVDKNGNPITYKGYKYFEKYSNAQINTVKGKLQELMSKYNIPFKYDYDVLFGTGTVSRAALSGEKGVYTHNSVRTDKSDVFPQRELIEMLKSIATEIVE